MVLPLPELRKRKGAATPHPGAQEGITPAPDTAATPAPTPAGRPAPTPTPTPTPYTRNGQPRTGEWSFSVLTLWPLGDLNVILKM